MFFLSATYDPNRVNQKALDDSVRPFVQQLDLVFFILPNNTLRRYAEVKNFATLQLGGKFIIVKFSLEGLK